jgi:hypothetical protein
VVGVVLLLVEAVGERVKEKSGKELPVVAARERSVVSLGTQE